jgi:hypothetical protein
VEQRTFRNASYPWLGSCAAVLLTAGGLLGAIGPHNASGSRRILSALVPILGAFITYRAYVRAKLVVRADGLTVFNPFRTIHFGWNDVESFDMVTQILRITPRTGPIIRVWAVQPSGLRHMVSRGAKGQAILDELNTMREQAKD